MRIKIYLLIIALSSLAFFSCEETKEENKYHNWRTRNEAFIDSLQQVVDQKLDNDLLTLTDERNGQTIFYKIIEKGDQDAPSPFSTSTVNVYYRGMLIDEALFAAAPAGTKYLSSLYEDLLVFDSSFDGPDPLPEFEAPYTTTVEGLITGWIQTLLWMHPGDRWELYIPHQSAYKSSSSGVVRAYSTLIFDLTLDSVKEL